MIKKLFLFFLVCILQASAFSAHATPVTTSPIGVTMPFSRATNGKNGAVFMTLTNATPKEVMLVGATTPICKTVELHTHIQEGDVYKMRSVPSIPIPAQGSVVLKPGGLHIMLMGLDAPLLEGHAFDLTLKFSDGHVETVTIPIQSPGHTACGCKNKSSQ